MGKGKCEAWGALEQISCMGGIDCVEERPLCSKCIDRMHGALADGAGE